ncbi:MAG: PhoH family protein [Ignisphaera sp.]|nr:PhoH family protein [Ignisphaera sp.]MCX8168044.1 PhoH family protein [Ignisphaera sp.]MDW8085767.1 PhoH family protein [Ignisphaera sp.]
MSSVWDRLKPLTQGQEDMAKALTDRSLEVVGFFGPTGTGKSLFSLVYGISSVASGDYSRFVIVRPIVDVVTGEEITVARSPAAFVDTMRSYLQDVVQPFIEWSSIESMIAGNKIVFADPHYLRGRTFDNSIVFLDDIQVMKPESIIEAIVRVGRNSRFIVAGDPVFQALKEVSHDPAALIREVLMSEEKSKVVDLGIRDIVREGAKRGLRFLVEYRLRSRQLSDEERRVYDAVKLKAPDADIVTVVDIAPTKRSFELSSEHVPDALIVVKQGHMGRLVGKGGERINAAEKELNVKLRGVELNLDFRDIVRALHPTSWIWKHVKEVDFAGPNLQIKVYEDAVGAAVGQRGSYVKFLDSVVRKLFGVGVRMVAIERPRQERRKGGRRSSDASAAGASP